MALQISEVDDLDGLLALLLAGLQARNVSGRLELMDVKDAPDVPEPTPLWNCQMTMLGQRERSWPHMHWRGDETAVWDLTRAGAAWCREVAAVNGMSLRVGIGPLVLVSADDDLDELLADAIARVLVHWFGFICAGVDRSRMLVVDPFHGRIELLEVAADCFTADGSAEPVASLRAFVAEHAAQLVYAYIKPGTRPLDACLARALVDDWPARVGVHRGLKEELAFQDGWAPDAFPIQLLGPGYHDRIPSGPACWQFTQLEDGRVLLEHHALPAWLPDVDPSDPAALETVALTPLDAARRDFADILYTEQIGQRVCPPAPPSPPAESHTGDEIGKSRRSAPERL